MGAADACRHFPEPGRVMAAVTGQFLAQMAHGVVKDSVRITIFGEFIEQNAVMLWPPAAGPARAHHTMWRPPPLGQVMRRFELS